MDSVADIKEALINSAQPSWRIFFARFSLANPPHSLCYASSLLPQSDKKSTPIWQTSFYQWFLKKKIDPVCRHYGVDKVFLFGSYARGEATEQSDIDLRVDLGDMLRGLDVAGFYADMEDALGRRVDIMTTRQLPKKFLQSIRSEEIQVYGHSG